MRVSQQVSIGLVFAASLMAWPLLTAQSQTPASPSTTQTSQAQPQNPCPQPQAQNGQASQTTSTSSSTQQNPQSTANGQGCTDQTSAQPAPQNTNSGQPGSDQPVPQQKTVHPKNSKEDVDAIGNRSVGKGMNFYSIEREIALGKQLAQEVERSSKMIDDPVVTEYVNRVGQNLVRNSDAQVPFTIKVIDSDEVNAFALPGGFFFENS